LTDYGLYYLSSTTGNNYINTSTEKGIYVLKMNIYRNSRDFSNIELISAGQEEIQEMSGAGGYEIASLFKMQKAYLQFAPAWLLYHSGKIKDFEWDVVRMPTSKNLPIIRLEKRLYVYSLKCQSI